jgi:Fur family peroxide stress response transcriptional regulator
MELSKLKSRLIDNGLKVTTRRLLILEAIVELNHPSAEDIIRYIRIRYPKVASATVYKALNILWQKKIIFKVETEKDIIRYDAIAEAHHHIYSPEHNRIEDYNDEELTRIIKRYFKTKKIKGFDIEDFKLQIIGKFRDPGDISH